MWYVDFGYEVVHIEMYLLRENLDVGIMQAVYQNNASLSFQKLYPGTQVTKCHITKCYNGFASVLPSSVIMILPQQKG